MSLTEDPELEIPVCKDIVKRYTENKTKDNVPAVQQLPYSPFDYVRRNSFEIGNIGAKHVPVVIADLSKIDNITPAHLQSVGYHYNEATDKWAINDIAADYIFTGHQILNFNLPGTLKVIVYPAAWETAPDKTKYFPIFDSFL